MSELTTYQEPSTFWQLMQAFKITCLMFATRTLLRVCHRILSIEPDSVIYMNLKKKWWPKTVGRPPPPTACHWQQSENYWLTWTALQGEPRSLFLLLKISRNVSNNRSPGPRLPLMFTFLFKKGFYSQPSFSTCFTLPSWRLQSARVGPDNKHI